MPMIKEKKQYYTFIIIFQSRKSILEFVANKLFA